MAEFDTLPITPKPTTPRSCAVTPHGLGQGGEDEAGAASRQALGLLGARFSTGRVFQGGLSEPGQAEGELASRSRRLQPLALLRLTPGLPLCPACLSHAPAPCSLAFGACAPCFFIFLMT